MKAGKKKANYSLVNNLLFVLQNMWKCEKKLAVYTFLRSPFVVAVPFLGVILSREVVGAVTEGRQPADVLIVIAMVSAVLIVTNIVDKCLSAQMLKFMITQDFYYQILLMGKGIESDYENVESSAGLTRFSKAMENTANGSRGARAVASVLSSFTANIIGVISYATILFRLSPWILLAITATTLSGFFVLKISASWNHRNKDSWKAYDRKLEYLRRSSADFTRAKDIRLYSMSDWFQRVFDGVLGQRLEWHKKEQRIGFGGDALRAALSVFRECVAYGFLVYLIYDRSMSVSDFVLYFGIISGFAGWLNGIVYDFDALNRFHLGFLEMREFLDYPDIANHGEGKPVPEDTFSIEFKNVCYRYPDNSEDTIKDLSFKVRKGEKLAIVGLNGAGKTTIVKLICGLYNPTSGEILIDGQPINAYNREEYYTLFSAVFQEIFLMPLSIARNVSASVEEETDRRRVNETLSQAGLSAVTETLPDGMDTRLVKSAYEDAVDLSGGEIQKLALARALYKKGRALILDEPTAALDPIAENSIYQEYNQMTSGRTSVFISHRLASTRFCDRIFFLEQGKILENGTHDELMDKRGRYFEMYEVQSQYYREGVPGNEDQ